VLKSTNRAGVELGSAAALVGVTVQNTASSGIAVGNGSSSSAYASAFISRCKIIAVSDGMTVGKTGSSGLRLEDSFINTQGYCFSNNVGGTADINNCVFSSDATGNADARGIVGTGGSGSITIFSNGRLDANNGSTSNVAASSSGSGTIL